MEKIEYILKCIKRGWVVFPLVANTKVPRKGWHWHLREDKYQFSTEEQVLGHWLDHPKDNYGIITGISGLKVVDVDCGSKPDGRGVMVKKIVDAKYIQEIDQYPTLTVRSYSGGFHYYYKTDGTIDDFPIMKDNGDRANIDIKGKGYVVGFGSVVQGKEYELLGGEIASMPILSFIPDKTPIIIKKKPNSDSFELDKVLKALEYISSDDYEVWYRVGMAIKDAGGDMSIWDEWSKLSGKYKEGECAKKWESFKGEGVSLGTIYHLAQKQGLKLESPKIRLKRGVLQQEVLTTINNSSLPINLMDQGDDLSWLGDGSKKYAYYETGIAWIDKGMHGLQKRTILTAPSNTGKTLLALQIAKSVSKSGRPVLYIDMEQPIKDLWIRVMTMGTPVTKEDFIINGQNIINSEEYENVFKYHKEDAKNIDWTDLESVNSLDELDNYISNWAKTKDQEPLIIIDQVSGLKQYTGKDTMYEQTQVIADWLRYGLRDKPWTVLMLSPQNKAQNNKQTEMSISGSGELAYAVDCVMVLSKIEEDGSPWDRKRVQLNIAKTRAGSLEQYDYYLRKNNKDEFEKIISSIEQPGIRRVKQ
jgi:KaiC/GvpD/RAD55 family RecA-like ATPase